jgi:hypothetical protein
MDNEEARFILRSFRPDGADVSDPQFAEALQLAVKNRELGEWLASERAFDSAFARALASVSLPENLREDILACLAGERTDFPQVEDSFDAAWVGALATFPAPPRLRDTVLTAMNRTAALSAQEEISIFRRAAIPLAAAAGIALAFLVTRPDNQGVVSQSPAVPISAVQAGFLRTYESPKFRLDEKREDQGVLLKSLKKRKLPCPSCLPPGLQNVKGIGCRELMIDGKQGSLVCFDLREKGVIHLVIFRREDVSCKVPPNGLPKFYQVAEWSTARWADDENVFLIMSRTDVGNLTELF